MAGQFGVNLTTDQVDNAGMSVELWADVDHHSNFSEGYNYAHHAVTVDD